MFQAERLQVLELVATPDRAAVGFGQAISVQVVCVGKDLVRRLVNVVHHDTQVEVLQCIPGVKRVDEGNV